jgi:hypothetical protein
VELAEVDLGLRAVRVRLRHADLDAVQAEFGSAAGDIPGHRHLRQLGAALDDQPGQGAGTGQANPVIFCGDLNDEPMAATTQIIQGPGGSEIDFRPGSGFRTGDRGDGYRMWNLYRLLPPEGPNYSRIYRGRGELIDHVFASHRLVNSDNIPAVQIVAASPLPSMTDDPTPPTSAPSDHAAVVATFSL